MCGKIGDIYFWTCIAVGILVYTVPVPYRPPAGRSTTKKRGDHTPETENIYNHTRCTASRDRVSSCTTLKSAASLCWYTSNEDQC